MKIQHTEINHKIFTMLSEYSLNLVKNEVTLEITVIYVHRILATKLIKSDNRICVMCLKSLKMQVLIPNIISTLNRI